MERGVWKMLAQGVECGEEFSATPLSADRREYEGVFDFGGRHCV